MALHMIEFTVGGHLPELQLSKYVGYPNTYSKATPTISVYHTYLNKTHANERVSVGMR